MKTEVSELSNPPRRIAVFRALPGLGDFLCVTPALRALRSAVPQAQIVLIGLPTTRELVSRFKHLIDEFIEFPGHPDLPEQPPHVDRLSEFFVAMQRRSFDLAIQMHGSGVVTNAVTIALGAQRTAGFFRVDQDCPDPTSFLLYEDSESEIRRYLQLMEYLGMRSRGEVLEFPIAAEDWQTQQRLTETHSLYPGRYLCIHPGASVLDRCWAIQNFAAVGDAIAERGLQVVLTGSATERTLTEAVAQHMQAPTLNLAGHTSLGTLAALLSQAALLVSNDTGVSHLAAALQVPSVVVFTGSDPQRWAPLDRDRHRAIHPPVSVAAVLEQASNLLQEVSYAT